MTEVIHEYEGIVEAKDGTSWSARACARPFDQIWEGWIEFIPLSAGQTAVRTRQETTQPERDDVIYWAGGISPTYLEGALARARERPTFAVIQSAPPLFDRPAPSVEPARTPPPPTPHPILDPYKVYAQGEERLVSQLAALDTDHLRGIVLGYELAPPETAALATRAELTAHILAAARGSGVRT